MTFTAACPSCGETLDVDEEHRGWTVRCPQCRHEFVAGGDEPRPRPYSRPRRDEDDDEEFAPRPRRRRRRYSEYDEPDFAAARARVSSAATFMEIVGWGSAVLFIGLAVFLFIVGMQNQNQNQNRRGGNQAQDDADAMMVVGGCLGVIGVPYSVVMAIGGRKMRNLSSRGWAMTSAIMGIAAIALFGLCGVIQIAAGIWALTALMDKNVEECFKTQERSYRRRDDDSFDDE